MLKALLQRSYFILDKPKGAIKRIYKKGRGERFVVPISIHSQLETMLYQLVDEVERQFLAELQNAVFDPPPNTHGWDLPVFLSVWVMGHTYAFFAAVASAYQGTYASRISQRIPCVNGTLTRAQNPEWKEKEFFDHMNRLSRAIQKAKFRSSPLKETSWSKVPDYAIIKSDPDLLKTMVDISTREKGELKPVHVFFSGR
jgi:hypothetical protein